MYKQTEQTRVEGADVFQQLNISPSEAALGKKIAFTSPDGKTLELQILKMRVLDSTATIKGQRDTKQNTRTALPDFKYSDTSCTNRTRATSLCGFCLGFSVI